VLHYSNGGSQYTSEPFRWLIVCSVSRSGNVWDNAGMESFFSSLKIAGLPPWRNLGKVWLNG
jgi:putative transposase